MLERKLHGRKNRSLSTSNYPVGFRKIFSQLISRPKAKTTFTVSLPLLTIRWQWSADSVARSIGKHFA